MEVPGAENQDPGDDDWVIPRKPIGWRTIAVVVGLAITVGLGAFVVITSPAFRSEFGPAPVWHSFGGIFSNSGELVSEDCKVGNTQPILGGINGVQKMTPESTISCSYKGEDYLGVIGTDCNLTPSGPIPSVNGTLIPYDGCVLSFAPLNYLFTGLFITTTRANSGTLTVYSDNAIVANITIGTAWKNFQCSLASDNMTKSTGSLACSYLGVPYVSTNFTTACNFGNPIQVNGVAIPYGGCMLQRSETTSD